MSSETTDTTRIQARPDIPLMAVWAAVGSVVSTAVFGIGLTAVLLGAIAGSVACEARRRRRSTRARVAAQEDFPEALESLAEAIRAKGSLRLGILEVAASCPPSVAGAFRRAASLLEGGLSLEDAVGELDEVADLPGSAALELALRTHVEAGGNLPGALEALAASLRQRNSIRRELDSLTAQARLSSVVLASAPLGFAALSYVLGLGGRFLLRTPQGLCLVVAGLALEAVGFWWVRRICAVRW